MSFRGFHYMDSVFSQHLYTGKLKCVACGCSTRNAQNKGERLISRLTLALEGSHRPVSFTRVYTPRHARNRRITRSLQS